MHEENIDFNLKERFRYIPLSNGVWYHKTTCSCSKSDKCPIQQNYSYTSL